MKKTVLFEVDLKNWAFYYLVKSWAEQLTEEYDCYVFYNEIYRIKPTSRKPKAYAKIYNFVSGLRFKFYNNSNQNHGISFLSKDRNYYFKRFTKPETYLFNDNEKPVCGKLHFDYLFRMTYFFPFVTEIPFSGEKEIIGIFNDCYPLLGPDFDFKNNVALNDLPIDAFFDRYLKKYDYILAANANIKERFGVFTPKIEYSLGIYKESEFGKNKTKSSVFTLGWTGNPNRPVKGFYEIIVPAVEIVKNSGREIHLKTAFDLTYDEMIDFYGDVDLAVIASNGDGAPTMFAEACLSSIPSVSTWIGLPSMVIQDGINGIFVNRDIQQMADAITLLYDDREMLERFSKRIRQDYLEVLSNEKMIENLKKILTDC